jgi:hypothetical protein
MEVVHTILGSPNRERTKRGIVPRANQASTTICNEVYRQMYSVFLVTTDKSLEPSKKRVVKRFFTESANGSQKNEKQFGKENT